jgi:fructose-1,6-bisphosphatase/inositol monophosphatase family enzyme
VRLHDDLALRRRVAEEAARAGGAVHLRYFGRRLDRDVHGSNRADYTTAADMEAQAAVKQTIERYFPYETVVGEEDLELRASLGELLDGGCWLTDPLDGTQEFAHGNPGFSCVVGYVANGRSLVGAVYFPVWDEMFSASEGGGATMNGGVVHVSGVSKLEQALVAVPQSNVSSPERAALFVQHVSKLVPHVEGLRMPGARSLMVCGVAAGRYDLTSTFPRFGMPVDRPFVGQPWETAAFVVLVEEAGGVVASVEGDGPELLGYNTYAATRELIEAYRAVIGE